MTLAVKVALNPNTTKSFSCYPIFHIHVFESNATLD